MEEKQLLKVDNYEEGEKQDFSLIEVYPYLHYRNDEDTNEIDTQKCFELSKDRNKCVLVIHVRSREAQKEIMSYLVGHEFEDVKAVEGNVLGITECKLQRDAYKVKELENRKYFNVNDHSKMLLTKSSLGIRVKVDTDEFPRFKEVIKCLRYKRSYRNKWLDDEKEYIIK